MIVAAALLWTAVVLAVTARSWLERLTFTLEPDVAIRVWLVCLVAVVGLVVTGVVVLAWPGHAPMESVADAAAQCLAASAHAVPHWLSDPVSLFAIAAVVAAAIRVAVVARRKRRVCARVTAYHRDVLAIVARESDGSHPVMWLEYAAPFAYSIDGNPGVIVATDGLADILSDSEQRAVFAHERAHLRGRHHKFVLFCDILATALPRVPLFAAAPRAMAALVELAADEHGAAATSRSAMHGALRTVSRCAPDPKMSLPFGSGLIPLRLGRLQTTHRAPSRAVALGIALSPMLIAAICTASILLGAAATACLVLSN